MLVSRDSYRESTEPPVCHMFSESFDFDQQFSDLDLGGRERKGGGVTLHRQLQHNGIADCILKNVGDEDTPNRHCTVGNKCLSILS